jgi:hypothetical protein
MTTISASGFFRYSPIQSDQTNGSENPFPENNSSVHDKVTLSGEAKRRQKEKLAGSDSTIQLSNEDLRILDSLKKRDREVRTHEQAHLAAAGRYAGGGAQFTTRKGPDGHAYAVSGEVPIDVSRENSPEATISKMETIKRAALAPQTPSSADRRIAAEAAVKEAEARKELMMQNQEVLLNSETQSSRPDSASPQSQKGVSVKLMISSYGSSGTLVQNPSSFSIVN